MLQEERETDPDDSKYRLVFSALDELGHESWKSFFKKHFLQDETLFFMESEKELKGVLTQELQPGLPYGLAFQFSRLWFNKYHTDTGALKKNKDELQATQHTQKQDTVQSKAQTASKCSQQECTITDSSRVLETEISDDTCSNCEDSTHKTSEWVTSQKEKKHLHGLLNGQNSKSSLSSGTESVLKDDSENFQLHSSTDPTPQTNDSEGDPSGQVLQDEHGDVNQLRDETRDQISTQEADAERIFPDSLRSGEEQSSLKQQFSCSTKKPRKRRISKRTDSAQRSTKNEKSNEREEAPSEGLLAVTLKTQSLKEERKLKTEEAAVSAEEDVPDENNNAIRDSRLSAATMQSKVVVHDTILANPPEDRCQDVENQEIPNENGSGLLNQPSSSSSAKNIPVGPSIPEERCYLNVGKEEGSLLNTGFLQGDSGEILRCKPRPLGVKGRDTYYNEGAVLDSEENREVEFKSLSSAPTSSLPWKIMEKAKKFVCACLNGDKKGIIYFGVADCQEQESKFKRGEILGLEVENIKDDIVKAFQFILDDHVRSDAGPLQKGGEQDCVKMEFVPVFRQGSRTKRYIIEIEVVRDWKFCKDNIYYSKRWIEKQPFRIDNNALSKKALSDFFKVKDELDDVAIRTNGSSTCVKPHDVNRQVKEPLMAKYKEWKREKTFGNNGELDEANLDDLEKKRLCSVLRERLRDLNFKEFKYILVANKLSPKYRGTPNLSFLQNIPWVAVFDLFDPASKKDGLHYVCNETTDALRAKIKTLNDLKQGSRDWIADKTSPVSTLGTAWIFNNEEMQETEWITSSKDSLYRALSAYNSRFLGRLMFVFLGLGENAILEMSDIVECCFSILGGELASKSVTVISESKHVTEAFIKTSKPSLRKQLRDCTVAGIPWHFFKEIVHEMVGPSKFKERGATTELPYFTGKKEVLNKVIHSWDNLEVYSPNPVLSNSAEEIERARDAFYRGAQASQTNLFHNHSIQRTLEEKIFRKIDQALKSLSKSLSDLNCHVKTVSVPYEPGSGVTTMCRRILWNKRADYRCALVKAITATTDFQIEQLQSIAYDDKTMKYSLPVLVLVDNFPEIDIRRLTERLAKRETKCVILSTFPVTKSNPDADFEITPLRQLDETETRRVINILINITSDSGRRREAEKVLERQKRFIWFGLELFGRDYVKIEDRLKNHITSTMTLMGDTQGIHEMLLNFCCLLHFYSNGRAMLPHPVVCDLLYEANQKTSEELANTEHIHSIFGGLLLDDFNETHGYNGWRPAHSLVSEVVKSRISIEETAVLLLEKAEKGKAYAIKFLQDQAFQVFLNRKRISGPFFLKDSGTDDDDVCSDPDIDVFGFYEVRTRYSPLIMDILEGENGIPKALRLLITICEKANETDYKAYAWQQLARFMGYEMSSKAMDMSDTLHQRLHTTMGSLFQGEGNSKLPVPQTGIEAAHVAVDIAIIHQPGYSHHYVTKGVLYLLQLRDFKPEERPNLIVSMPEVVRICHKAQEVYDKALTTKDALNHYSIIGKIQAIVLLLEIFKGLPFFFSERDSFACYLKNEQVPHGMEEALSDEDHNFVQSLSFRTRDLLNQIFRDVKFRQLTTHDENELRCLTSAKIRASKLRRKFYEITGFDRRELTDPEDQKNSSPLTKQAPAVYQEIVQDILFKREETPYSSWASLDDGDVSLIYNLLKAVCLRGHGNHDGMLIFSRACLRLKERPAVDELDTVVSTWVAKFSDSEWAHLFNYMIHFPIPNGSLAVYSQSAKASIKKCDNIVREKTGWRARKSGAEYFLGMGKGLNAIVSSTEFPLFEKQWVTKTDFWRSRKVSEKLERVRGQKELNCKGVITYQGINLRFDNTRYPNESKDDLWFYVGFSLAGPYAYDPVDNDTFTTLTRKSETIGVPSAFPMGEASHDSDGCGTDTDTSGRRLPLEMCESSAKPKRLNHVDQKHPNEVPTDVQDFPQIIHLVASIPKNVSMPLIDASLGHLSDTSGPSDDSSSPARSTPNHPFSCLSSADTVEQPSTPCHQSYALALQRGQKEQSSKASAGQIPKKTLALKGMKGREGFRGKQKKVFQPVYVDEKGKVHHGSMVLGAYKSKECETHTIPSFDLHTTTNCSFAHGWRGDTLEQVCSKCTEKRKRVCRDRKNHHQFIWNLGPYHTQDARVWQEPSA